MNFQSGYLTKKDFHDVFESSLFIKLETENDDFKKKYLSFIGDYGDKWTSDSFHQWSRVWEYPYIYKMVENKVKSLEESRILDAGCGLSFFPFQIKKDFAGVEMHGADLDPDLERTYEKLNKEMNTNIVFKLCDLRKLDYPDNFFDLIYCVSVLEHTEDYKEIVDIFYKIIKPGGHVVLTFDISLDSDRKIPVEEGQLLLDYLNTRFRTVYNAKDIKQGISQDILTTKYVSKFKKELLPWKSPWKNFLKNILNLKKPKLTYNLACYCQVFEKPL